MFEEYLQDASNFYDLAKNKISEDENESKRFFRVSIFCSIASMEAFINFLGITLKSASIFDKFEIAFINDLIIEFSPNKLKTTEKTRYQSLDEKVKFIIKKLKINIDLSNSPDWNNFISIKKLRDELVHSRHDYDENSIDNYIEKVKNGFNSILNLINIITLEIFKKPLRKGILDLLI